MSEEERVSTTTIERISDYEFRVKFDMEGVQDLLMDEPKPLGGSKGANASRILAAAVANCLSASFVFCLSKWKIPLDGLKTTAKSYVRRNEKGRWRVRQIEVMIHPQYRDPTHERIPRCIEQFEDFCVVTESVRSGIPVKVSVD